MKILIKDYSSEHSTEPHYLNTIFNMIECNSTLWNNNLSTFDMFDLVKPDIYLTHFHHINKDVMLYLAENRDIDLILNITGMSQDQLQKLESIFIDAKINPALLFVNQYDPPIHSKKYNIVPILHGADIFLPHQPKEYDIECAIFVNNKEQIKPMGDTYHCISNNSELQENADIIFPIHMLAGIYHNYNKCVIRYFNNVFSQLFFDAAIRIPTFFDISNRESLNKNLSKLLGSDEYCNIDNLNSGSIADKIKSKHTCLHRAKSVLSQLPCKQYLDNLQDIIDRSIQ